MEIESKQQILERRKEIEQELVDMLKETESDFTLDHVRDAIYNEEDNDDMMKAVAMFDRGACPPKPRRRRGDATELSNVLELVTDAWNYPGTTQAATGLRFPHKALNGISPAEKLLEHQSRQYDKEKRTASENDDSAIEHEPIEEIPDKVTGAFGPFPALFPDRADFETRKVILVQNTFGLPKGIYFLVENYCLDKTCDCRKVMINVITMDVASNILGTVGFGWEDGKFYGDWTGDEILGRQMVGAYVEPGGIQTELSGGCLELVKNSLQDKYYIDLIKKHYREFKEKIALKK